MVLIGMALGSTTSSEKQPLTPSASSLSQLIFYGDEGEDGDDDPELVGTIISVNTDMDDYEEYISTKIMPMLQPNLCKRAIVGISVTLTIIGVLSILFYYVMHKYYDWF